MTRYPPAGFVTRLRRAVGEPTLTIEFDDETANRTGKDAWTVLYLETGRPTWVTDWLGTLDGALDPLTERVKRVYFGWVDPKDYARTLNAKYDRIRAQRKAKRLDEWQQRSGYMRRAFQAYADGSPVIQTRCFSGASTPKGQTAR